MTSNPPTASRPYTDSHLSRRPPPPPGPTPLPSTQISPPTRLRPATRSRRSPPSTSSSLPSTSTHPTHSTHSSSAPAPAHPHVTFHTSHVRFKTEPTGSSSSSSPASLSAHQFSPAIETQTSMPAPIPSPVFTVPTSLSATTDPVAASAPAPASTAPPAPTSPSRSLPPRDPPLMVALAGWPEPVFVGQVRDPRRLSRPNSPPSLSPTQPTHTTPTPTQPHTQPHLPGPVSTRHPMAPPPTIPHSVRPPSPNKGRSKSPARTRSPSFPTSGASGHYNHTANHNHARFADPRHTVIGNKTLPVVPAWSGGFSPESKPPIPFQSQGSHHTDEMAVDHELGDEHATDAELNEAGSGFRVERIPVLVTHRAVPEVWPPVQGGGDAAVIGKERLRRRSESALRHERV